MVKKTTPDSPDSTHSPTVRFRQRVLHTNEPDGRDPDIEFQKNVAMADAWKRIQPHIEAAISKKMQEMGVPASPDHKTTFNHFYGTSVGVSRSYFDQHLQNYMDLLFADSKDMLAARQKMEVSEQRIASMYANMQKSVKNHGNLKAALIDDGSPANLVISKFTNDGTPVEQQLDPVHLTLQTPQGTMEENLTKLLLLEKFMQIVELAGLDVMMAYLKREYKLPVEADESLLAGVPSKPEDPIPAKSVPKRG